MAAEEGKSGRSQTIALTQMLIGVTKRAHGFSPLSALTRRSGILSGRLLHRTSTLLSQTMTMGRTSAKVILGPRLISSASSAFFFFVYCVLLLMHSLIGTSKPGLLYPPFLPCSRSKVSMNTVSCAIRISVNSKILDPGTMLGAAALLVIATT